MLNTLINKILDLFYFKNTEENPYRLERKLVFLFLFLLIFEGALRKWFLPFLATPLVVARDPLALLLVIQGIRRGFFENNYYVKSCFILSIISFGLSFFLDETNLMVSYYGTRIFLFYIPSIFVMSRVLRKNDIYKIGKYCLYISIPMTILIICQYFSPQTSIVNQGIGGDTKGSGFGGVAGFYRPSGVFSFTQGYVAFQGFVITYILIFLFETKTRLKANISLVFVLLCLIVFIVSLPFSISRTNIIQSVLITFTAIMSSIISGTNRLATLKYMSCIVAVCVIIMFLPQMETIVKVMMLRFEQAERAEGNLIEGSIIYRYFGAFIRPWEMEDVPLLGHGIGQGTRLAIKALHVRFFTDEEWTRTVYESGFILGASYLIIRCGLALEITILTLKQAYLRRNFIALVFLPSTVILLVQAPFGNAVPLGFTVVSTAFSMVCLQKLKEKKGEQEV